MDTWDIMPIRVARIELLLVSGLVLRIRNLEIILFMIINQCLRNRRDPGDAKYRLKIHVWVLCCLLIHRCINNSTGRCNFALNTTLYFPPSSKLTALDDLTEIRKNVFFTDLRCDISIQFSACYLLRVPCDDSLPRPICIDDCIVAETILKYSCAKDFKLILLVNNTLSHIIGQFVCQQPETYIEGTTNYSTHCFPLSKLSKYVYMYAWMYLCIYIMHVHMYISMCVCMHMCIPWYYVLVTIYIRTIELKQYCWKFGVLKVSRLGNF